MQATPTRRRLLGFAAGALVLASPLSRGQPPVRTVGLCVLKDMDPGALERLEHPFQRPFVEAMRERGWAPGRNVRYAFRAAFLEEPRRAIFREFIAMPVDVIVAPGNTAADLAQMTRTIPVVGVGFAPDSVPSGRPGSNVTGVTRVATSEAGREARGKLLALTHELTGARNIAYVWMIEPGEPAEDAALPIGPQHRQMAGRLGVKLFGIPARDPAQLDRAFAQAIRQGVGALVMENAIQWPAPLAERLAALVRQHRLPMVSEPQFNPLVEPACVATWGVDSRELFVRAAYFVDRILGGTRPGELPVESLEGARLTLDLRRAEALGLKVPPALMVQAERVAR